MRLNLAPALLLTMTFTIAACSTSKETGGQVTHVDLAFEPTPDKAGGQPGAVTLRGSLVNVQGRPVEQVRVTERPGRNTVGQAARLISAQGLSPDLNPNDRRELALVKTLGTFAQFGCNEHFAEDVNGLREQKFELKAKALVRAQVVIFCGPIETSPTQLRVVADRVLFVATHLRLHGDETAHLEVIANDFSIRGENHVDTKGADNAAPRGAPRVSLAGNHVSGLGQLLINAEGNDWVAKATPAGAPAPAAKVPDVPPATSPSTDVTLGIPL